MRFSVAILTVYGRKTREISGQLTVLYRKTARTFDVLLRTVTVAVRSMPCMILKQ
jgi:hypothetical protein